MVHRVISKPVRWDRLHRAEGADCDEAICSVLPITLGGSNRSKTNKDQLFILDAHIPNPHGEFDVATLVNGLTSGNRWAY